LVRLSKEEPQDAVRKKRTCKGEGPWKGLIGKEEKRSPRRTRRKRAKEKLKKTRPAKEKLKNFCFRGMNEERREERRRREEKKRD
jgi:hypothetical protein